MVDEDLERSTEDDDPKEEPMEKENHGKEYPEEESIEDEHSKEVNLHNEPGEKNRGRTQA